MQNRSMFPYRRHGPKKRVKNGPNGPIRKPHGAPKGLPNSARDLLPMLQPATKALAQVLAGRTQMSGQLEQARAVLGQAERLIADRVHNRLNPAEREEFFEQIARLRLTLADADSEAEFRAVEQQAPPRPAPPPIAQERLKEMAMALTTPEGRRRPSGNDDATTSTPRAVSKGQPVGATPALDRGVATLPEVEEQAADALPPPAEPAVDSSAPRRLMAINRPGRLELPRDAAADASRTLSVGRGIGRRRASGGVLRAPAAPPATPTPAAAEPFEPAAAVHDPVGNGAAEKARATRRSRKTQQGLPEGWIIDDEGFVVPGPD